jgi:hypothetical protein
VFECVRARMCVCVCARALGLSEIDLGFS